MKKIFILLPCWLLSGCVPLALGGMAVVGTSATEERGLEGVTKDVALRTDINAKWGDNKYSFTDLELTVYKGRVLITGFAKDKAVKEEAIGLTRQVKGVKEIIDGIEIGNNQDFQDYTSDGWITTKLKSSLYFDKKIQAPNYVIRTFNRKVFIFGTAQNKEEVAAVINMASNVKGVKHVKNLIEIKITKGALGTAAQQK